MLQVTHYLVKSPKLPQAFDGFRVLHLTDLHGRFGGENADLLEAAVSFSPNIVVTTGDMINAVRDDGRVFLALAEKLCKRYPLYGVSGNHEGRIRKKRQKFYKSLHKDLVKTGMKLIDNGRVPLQRGGESICLYGLVFPLDCYKPALVKKARNIGAFTSADIARCFGAADRTRFNLLLAHSPFYFDACAEWGADLTLCGHVHGGIIRLPFVGGLLSPDATFFPKYDAGRFEKDGAVMIVGRGLGENGGWKIRINNPPELVAVTLRRTEPS